MKAYYEGETYRQLMDELYEYGCKLAESGDDYDTVMDSCGKKYSLPLLDIQRHDISLLL